MHLLLFCLHTQSGLRAGPVRPVAGSKTRWAAAPSPSTDPDSTVPACHNQLLCTTWSVGVCGPSSLKHPALSGLGPPELTGQLSSKAPHPEELHLLTFVYSVPLACGALSNPWASCPDLGQKPGDISGPFLCGPSTQQPHLSVTTSSLRAHPAVRTGSPSSISAPPTGAQGRRGLQSNRRAGNGTCLPGKSLKANP